MADFTEEELLKAMGEDTENDGVDPDLAKDIQEEEGSETPEKNEPESEAPEEPATPPQEEEKPQEPAETAEKNVAENPEKVADEPATPDPEPKMILGKFKTQEDLEKAYQNLEKRLGEKAQEKQEVKEVTSDEFDRAVGVKIAEETWKAVEKAFETISDPEHAKDAQYLLSQYKRTGDAEFLEKARGFLDARVDRRLEVEAMNIQATISQKANEHRQEILLKPLADELDKINEEDPSFFEEESNRNLVGMAIRLNPTRVNVREVKKEIQGFAKLNYDKGYEAAKKEFAKQAEKKTVSLKSKAEETKPVPKKNPENMTIQEELEMELKSLL